MRALAFILLLVISTTALQAGDDAAVQRARHSPRQRIGVAFGCGY